MTFHYRPIHFKTRYLLFQEGKGFLIKAVSFFFLNEWKKYRKVYIACLLKRIYAGIYPIITCLNQLFIYDNQIINILKYFIYKLLSFLLFLINFIRKTYTLCRSGNLELVKQQFKKKLVKIRTYVFVYVTIILECQLFGHYAVRACMYFFLI